MMICVTDALNLSALPCSLDTEISQQKSWKRCGFGNTYTGGAVTSDQMESPLGYGTLPHQPVQSPH